MSMLLPIKLRVLAPSFNVNLAIETHPFALLNPECSRSSIDKIETSSDDLNLSLGLIPSIAFGP
jgi:hypothetical protein